jgi:hypothetical protein
LECKAQHHLRLGGGDLPPAVAVAMPVPKPSVSVSAIGVVSGDSDDAA